MLPPRINTHDWKHSTIILLHKDNPTIIANFRPEALGSTIYKLFMSTKHLYLLDLEKPQNTTSYPRRLPPHEKYNPRIQAIITALENAKITNTDIYLTYIEFKTTFGSINHHRPFATVEDLDYPWMPLNL